MTRVLVTCPPMLKQIECFEDDFASYGWDVTAADVTQTLTEDELIELLPGYEGWVIGDDPATERVLEAGLTGSFRAAVKWGVGTDNVDLEAFAERGVPVTNTPAMFGDEVADVALGYTIGLARELFAIDRSVRAGGWAKPTGISLRGKIFGLVGFGNIGRSLAARLVACGMQVVAFDPFLQPETELPDGVARGVWPEGVQELDFVGFTCALTPANRHMLNAEVLAQCKRGVRVVNVARGPLIDEAALIAALETGRVAACALDVFEMEPVAADAYFCRDERCIVGSHNGSNTLEAVLRTSRRAMELLDQNLRQDRS